MPASIVSNIQVVAKQVPGGIANAVSFLGKDGVNYVLFYRTLDVMGVPGPWTPVTFVVDFPS